MRAPLLLLALVVTTAPAVAHAAREPAKASYGLRLGAATAVSSAAPDTRTAIGGGGYVLWDIPGLLADASVDVFAGESRARFLAAGLGAYATLLDGETLPYVGGGVKLAWTRFGGDGATGLVPFGAIGLLVGRSWSPQLRIEAAWFFQTGTERRDAGAPARHANGPLLTFGIGF